MPVTTLLAIILGASALLSTGAHIYANRRTNEANERIAKEAQEYEMEMWKMQNEYNTPANQMQRLMAAGLNPNLMYSQGSTGNASSAPSPHKANIINELEGVNLNQALNMLGQYQDYALRQKQLEASEINVWRQETQANLDSVKLAMLRNELYDNLSKYGRHGVNLEGTERWEYMRKIGEIEKLMAERGLDVKIAESIMKDAEADMASQLREYNMTNADSIWARLLVNLMNKLGIKPEF